MTYLRIAVALLLAQVSGFATTITVLPGTQSVGSGGQVVVSLNVTGLGDGVAPSVGTFDLDVAFDSTILALHSATFGNQLDILGLGDLQFVTPGLGTVNLFELSLDLASDLNSLQAPAFVLATLTFDTLGSGTSPVSLSLNALGDADGNGLPAQLVDGGITVSAVSNAPEPNTFVAAVGLVGLVWFRRRSRT